MKRIHFYIIICLTTFLSACGSNEPHPAFSLIRQSIAEGATVDTSLTAVSFIYSNEFTISNTQGVTLNNTVLKIVKKGQTIEAQITLEVGHSYCLHIAAGTLCDSYGQNNTEITLNFNTGKITTPIFDDLCTPTPSAEAIKLYNYLKEQYGRHILSGVMANINWNTNEAQWVHQHTGTWPALTCFDLIHLHETWLKPPYSNASVFEEWWNNNGIVAGMWHQLVPAAEGEKATTYKPDETTFHPNNIFTEGSWERTWFLADLDSAADCLKNFRDRHIPVIWRPLHEASGAWFWWGSKGADTYVKIWQLMYDRMVNTHGLNNLIWVWTTQGNDMAWYPGDAYVDMVGRDVYGKSAATVFYDYFAADTQNIPNKMLTLSECGKNGYALAAIADQWTAGAQWSWFMPWYDSKRTASTSEYSVEFAKTEHTHADIDYWEAAFAAECVLSRDELPDLK